MCALPLTNIDLADKGDLSTVHSILNPGAPQAVSTSSDGIVKETSPKISVHFLIWFQCNNINSFWEAAVIDQTGTN